MYVLFFTLSVCIHVINNVNVKEGMLYTLQEIGDVGGLSPSTLMITLQHT